MAAQKISFAAEVCFLISLSACFPLDSAQTFPYISFNGAPLANHSYVNFSLGSGSDIQCHTDLGTCCSGRQGPHRGDWYFPNGTQLPFSGDVTVYEARGAQRVELHHTTEGIYCCDIATNAVHDDADMSVREAVYVGLYINGGNDGSIALKCFIIIVYR